MLKGLDPDRKLAYTSVSTILRILEKKGFLASRKDGRAHVYRPTLAREVYEARAVRLIVDNVFDGQGLCPSLSAI